MDTTEASREIASAWQAAYAKVHGSPAPTIEVCHTWIKTGDSWHPADEIRHRTVELLEGNSDD